VTHVSAREEPVCHREWDRLLPTAPFEDIVGIGRLAVSVTSLPATDLRGVDVGVE